MDSKTIFACVKIAYVYYEDGGPLSDKEHELLLQFLQAKGLNIHKENWDDGSVDWMQYQCIVLKSPWDYVFKTKLFYEWLDKIKQLNILMLNSADIIKWNSDKHYLKDIAAAGLKVIPTAFLQKGEPFHPEDYFKLFNTNTLIVKPCISGASRNTFKITAESEPVEVTESTMIQPFVPQVNEEGEWSLVFLGGKFSHALVKTPAKEDFRSQPQFGGMLQGKQPPASLLNSAAQYVAEFARGCLYARVDGLMIDNEFHLMELELIDPFLFLSIYPPGYDNYFEALKNLLD